jgi:HAE1 family hydrophobic/amphiphilic exporter-1
VNQDAIHPQVDLNFNLSASGSGGTRITYGDGFPPAILSTTSKGFGSVLGDAFTSLYPRWTLGVNVGYPIGHTAAKAALASTQIQQQQQHNTQRQLELDIVGQVRQAARDVQTSYERVQATQAGREASELQLRAEERRFAVGLTDLFTLQSRQSQLAAARVSELNAVIAYNNALIEFDRVQKIQ